MSRDDSILQLIEGVKAGDDQSVQAIWDAFFPQLCHIAGAKLKGQRRADADEEDVALSAFASFCKAAAGNRFPDLVDRKGLWRLLSEMTRRKAVTLIRYRQSLKRDMRRTVGESALMDSEGRGGMDRLLSDELTPALSLFLQEEARNMLEKLEDQRLVQLALLKLHGYTNQEIHDELNCSVSTVERQLNLIRKIWQQESP